MIALILLALDLATLARIESSNNPQAIGDHGKAHGAYQMHAGAWADVSAARAKRGAQVFPFTAAHDAKVSALYASEYLSILRKTFTATQGRNPTSAEEYALWNLGHRGFQRRGFSLSNTPKTTQNAVNKIQ